MSILSAILMTAAVVLPALLGANVITIQGTVMIENETPGNVAVAVFDDAGGLVGITNTTDTGEFMITPTNNTPGWYKVLAISHDGYGGVRKYYAPAPILSNQPAQNITVSVT